MAAVAANVNGNGGGVIVFAGNVSRTLSSLASLNYGLVRVVTGDRSAMVAGEGAAIVSGSGAAAEAGCDRRCVWRPVAAMFLGAALLACDRARRCIAPAMAGDDGGAAVVVICPAAQRRPARNGGVFHVGDVRGRRLLLPSWRLSGRSGRRCQYVGDVNEVHCWPRGANRSLMRSFAARASLSIRSASRAFAAREMASTVTSTNNLSLRSILEKDKLTGPNFLDWERNLMIVLRHERKWYVLEEPLGEAPPATAPAAARNAHKKHSDDLLDVACLMLATMSPDLQAGLINTNAYDMIRQLRDMF
ncbi:hypothetical protein OSB04_002072 [Centaurea solstitialis]|uniref:Uncharacterized protein n=1 Tax=Centaurea solstitialis TaxID=347529 RepID=A0AA38WV67_9ASTR|nr:hypothetical protein OSB04_002072 [Centaurea solstitialis]